MKTGKYQDPDRIYEEETVSGTAMSYAVTVDGFAYYPVDYELFTIEESHPEDMRARIKKGRQQDRIPNNKLQGELVILFGPTVSAKCAVELLKRLAKEIEREGLVIGRDRLSEFVYENKNGETFSV
jgi:hypothetical protein